MKYLSVIFTGIILALLLTSAKPEKGYNRAQFHFTTETGILPSPNGLVFYDGEYHIFYQYFPNNGDDNRQWGHAISENLINWKHYPVVFSAGFDSNNMENCRILSGSALVDEKNILRKQNGNEKTLLMFYAGLNCGIRIAYSTDKGMTWENFERNPVIPYNEIDDMRDPKVFWYEPTQKWIMTLSREIEDNDNSRVVSIYSSNDLINWEWKSNIPDFNENSDLVSIKVTNRPDEIKWVLFGKDGSYIIGDFDGETFSPETEKVEIYYGENYIAPQTWNNIPAEDGRTIQAAWIGGGYNDTDFNGQMTIPIELNITKFNSGYKLTRLPVKEIALLHGKHYEWTNKNMIPGINDNPLKKIKGTCFHIIAEFDVKTSNNFGFIIRYGKKDNGTEIIYNVGRETLSIFETTAHVPLVDNKVSFEILIDHTSIEIFANGGQVAITRNFAPAEGTDKYVLTTIGGELLIKQMDIYAIKTALNK